MKTVLILIGKIENKLFATSIQDYVGRICHYIPFEIITIPEIKNTKNLSTNLLKQREGELLLKLVQPSDTLVLLDEHGLELRSIELAQWLVKRNRDSRRLVFAIGGAYGFSQDVYQRANDKLSLSRLTFSHQMVRLVFAEQLYRACTIIKGEPYHHE